MYSNILINDFAFSPFFNYLAKLHQGGKYAFRMVAFSTAGVSSPPSPEVKLEIHGMLVQTIFLHI